MSLAKFFISLCANTSDTHMVLGAVDQDRHGEPC
jgi:hypothetical protein